MAAGRDLSNFTQIKQVELNKNSFVDSFIYSFVRSFHLFISDISRVYLI